MTTKTRTQTTKTAALWIASDGRITCVMHGGMALAAAVEARPERLAHLTDLDDWQAVTPEHVEQWAAQMGKDAAAEVARCETCRMQAPAREDQPMSTDPAPVIVWTRPACTACEATKRALDARGVAYEVRMLTQEDAERFRAEGHQQAPVIVTEAETWTGFRPDKIIELTKRAILPSDATREARTSAR